MASRFVRRSRSSRITRVISCSVVSAMLVRCSREISAFSSASCVFWCPVARKKAVASSATVIRIRKKILFLMLPKTTRLILLTTASPSAI